MKKFIYVLALLPALSFAQTTRDMQYCDAKSDWVDQAACLKEARNARAEERRGHLQNFGDFATNKYARCSNFQGADLKSCKGRVDAGATSGSVDGGGTITQYKEVLTQ